MPKLVKTTAEKSGIRPTKEVVKEIESATAQPAPKPERKKRALSDAQKAVLRERLVKAREAKLAKKKASEKTDHKGI